MNNDTNLGNGFEPENLGQPIPNNPINSENNGVESLDTNVETFNPFAEFSSEVNTAVETPVAPVMPEVPTVDTIAPAAPATEEVFAQPNVFESQPLSAVNPTPSAEIPSTPAFNPVQTEPVISDFNNVAPAETVSEPVMPTFDSFAAPVENTVAEQPVPEVAPVMPEAPVFDATPQTPEVAPVTGPTIPIPDSMPTTDYQAGVSTPVDFATPMNDFDQIGSTPELDPKTAGKTKKSGKTLIFCLIIIAIAALGAGSYYLINIKGIFNSESVVTKEITLELGDALSDDINDYATFKNTSASNCTQDTSSVDTFKVGEYEYTITCGKDSYTGKVSVVDTKAPDVTIKTNILTANTTEFPAAEKFVKECSEDNCTYKFEQENALQDAIASVGVKNVKLSVSDEAGNTKVVYIPVPVLDTDLRFAAIFTKELETTSEDYSVIEKNITLFTDLGSKLTMTMVEYSFGDADSYKEFIKNFSYDETATIEERTGIPVLDAENNKIVLVTESTSELFTGSYPEVSAKVVPAGYAIQVETAESFMNNGLGF
ncbi:MAG: hypothetical protein K6G37_01535 [Bacilli bacterium]|nr:hypothetical protein [Bacilli bacterium]